MHGHAWSSLRILSYRGLPQLVAASVGLRYIVCVLHCVPCNSLTLTLMLCYHREAYRMEVDLLRSPSATQYNPQTGEQLLLVSPCRCASRAGFDGLTNCTQNSLYSSPDGIAAGIMPQGSEARLEMVLVPVWPSVVWCPHVGDQPMISCGEE
jgi:hypothetical protein